MREESRTASIGTDPTPTKTPPVKSKTKEVITDQGKKLEHWVEHYLELYRTQNTVTDAALRGLTVMDSGRGRSTVDMIFSLRQL